VIDRANRWPTPAERFTAAGGVVLLVGLFTKWYTAGGVTTSGWHAVHVLRWLLVLTGLVAVGSVVARLAGRAGDLPFRSSTVLLVLGSVSTALVILRWVDHPHAHLSVRIGLLVALVGAVMLSVGARHTIDEQSHPGRPGS
jgi:hypothetical protein